MQSCYKNFDQHCQDNFQSQNQNKEWEWWDSHCSFQQNSQDFWWWESHDIQSLRWDSDRSKLSLFINKHDYCKKNNLCFRCNLSDHSVRGCKFSFNSDWMFVKNDKIKLQFYKIWVRKCTRAQTLHASNSSDNDKSNHNIHIITDDYESDLNRFCKHSKN